MMPDADGTVRNNARAANASIARRILVDVWGGGDLAAVDTLVAPDYVDHTPSGPESTTVRGTAGIKEAVRMFRAAFPDLQYSVELQIVEGDMVASRFTATGTHLGNFEGRPPTGRRVTYTGIDIARIGGGRIVEGWVNYDALALLEQVDASESRPR